MANVSPYSVNVSTPVSTKVVCEEKMRSPHPWVACRPTSTTTWPHLARSAAGRGGGAGQRGGTRRRQLVPLTPLRKRRRRSRSGTPRAMLGALRSAQASDSRQRRAARRPGTAQPRGARGAPCAPVLRHLAHGGVLAQAAVVVGRGQLGDGEGDDAQDLAGCSGAAGRDEAGGAQAEAGIQETAALAGAQPKPRTPCAACSSCRHGRTAGSPAVRAQGPMS